MHELTFAGAVLLWGVLPGYVLLTLLKLDWAVIERVAAAPGISLVLVAFSAYAAELVDLRVAPLPVAAVLMILCAAVFAVHRRMPPPRHAGALEAPFRDRHARWLPWLILLLPQVIVNELDPITNVVLLPPSLHDGLDHANWFRLIYEVQSVDPHEIMAPPFAPDGTPNYYPWGLHAWLALVARTTTLDQVAVLMQSLVFVSAILPLSVYVFAAHFAGRGWPAIAAAALSLLFWWLPYQPWGWGGYPLLAGSIAALPCSRLALVAVDRWHAPGVVAAAVCGVGLLSIHPSQAFFALVIAAATSATLAAAGVQRWRTTAPFALALGAAALALTIGPALWSPMRAFVERSARLGAAYANDPQYFWPAGVYLDNSLGAPPVQRVVTGTLYAAGAIVALWFRSTRPLVALHVVLSLLILATRQQVWLTTLWYHAPERLWYAQVAVLPALAALALAAIVMGVERLLGRLPTLGYGRILLWPVALWAMSAVVYGPFHTWAALKLFHHAQRNPNQTITDRRILADYRWIDANVPPGSPLFNAPADWGLPLPFTGRRTAFWSGGSALDPIPRWFDLLNLVRRGDPWTSHAAAELDGLGVHYVYAASLSPSLTIGRQPYDRELLKSASRLQLVYESPTAAIFRIATAGGARLGVRDSDRLEFGGFHPAEERGPRQWRWTIGDGRIRISTTGLPAGDCDARIHGPVPGRYVLVVDGEEIPLTTAGYVVRAAHRSDEVLEFLIRVPDAERRVVDGVAYGVRITNVELRCGP